MMSELQHGESLATQVAQEAELKERYRQDAGAKASGCPHAQELNEARSHTPR